MTSISKTAPAGRPDRRELLRRAIMLAGGVGAITALEACSGDDASTLQITPGSAGRYFPALHMEQLRAITDVMIPATDTPGALAAGVPEFLDAMMMDWASADTKTQMRSVLNQIDERSIRVRRKSFLRLGSEDRLAVMQAFDAWAFETGNGAYRRFKDLVLVGYYHSEVGATQELQFELIPGRWEACVPLEGMRTWAG